MPKLDDTVVLEPPVKPADVERALIEAVNFGWQRGGDDGRCDVPANFVGWALQEIGRLKEQSRLGDAAIDQLTKEREDYRMRWLGSMTPEDAALIRAENERLLRIEKAALVYFVHYLMDEADDECYCIDDQQHRLAVDLKDALGSNAEQSTGGGNASGKE